MNPFLLANIKAYYPYCQGDLLLEATLFIKCHTEKCNLYDGLLIRESG
jgi:hypothetical protein